MADRADDLYYGIFLLGMLILFAFGGFMFFQNIVSASYTHHSTTNETHATNLSATGHEIIFLEDPHRNVIPESIEPFDPADPGATVEMEQNVTLLDKDAGKLNVTSYYDADVAAHDIGFNYTARERSNLTAPADLAFGLWQFLVGLKDLAGYLLMVLILVIALYFAYGLTEGGGGSS